MSTLEPYGSNYYPNTATFCCTASVSLAHTTPLIHVLLSFRLPYFDVDPKNGSVFVKDSALLDREARSLYSPTLQARDTDGKPGSTVLEITLIDINDQPPVINRASYLEFVREGEQLHVVIEVSAAG